MTEKGMLYFMVGPSGAGKDTLLRYAREHVDPDCRVLFAHRYITRPAEAGGENHVALTADEFLLRRRSGLFAMDWESHGYRYGLGVEVQCWLERGFSVVVNGSRGHLETAMAAHPRMTVICVTADPRRLAERLAQRGRECAADIATRLARNAALPMPAFERVIVINNDGPLDVAGRQLLEIIRFGVAAAAAA